MIATKPWQRVKVGDLILDMQPGFACGLHNSTGAGIPHLRPMNVSIEGRIDRSELKFVSRDVAIRPERTLRHGDVLFNNTNSPELVGKTALFNDDDEPAFSNHMTRLRPDSTRITPEFLALTLHQVWRSGWFATHCNNHVSQASIGRSVLREVEVPLPPIDVQRRICASNKTLSASRRSATGHLMAARREVDRFRQSVLTAACTGLLTQGWRLQHEHVTPATDILRRFIEARQRRFPTKRPGASAPQGGAPLPTGWTWTTVGALVDVATGATPLRARPDYYGGDIPWITSGAVNDSVVTTCSEYITDAALRETNAKMFPPGTLIVAMYGEGQTRGRVAELGIAAATNQAVAALLFDPAAEALRPYIKLFFLQNYQAIRRESFGGVQPNLSLGVIRNIKVPLPPLEEQLEIVRIVNALMSHASLIEQRLAVVDEHAERASQTALNAALSGGGDGEMSEAATRPDS